jgi:hypothetical protein
MANAVRFGQAASELSLVRPTALLEAATHLRLRPRSEFLLGSFATGIRRLCGALRCARTPLFAAVPRAQVAGHGARFADYSFRFLHRCQLGNPGETRYLGGENIQAFDWHRTDLFTPEERLALEYAEATTLDKVDDDLRRRLKERWSNDALVELTALIAFQNLSAKFNSALDVPAQGFCRASQWPETR